MNHRATPRFWACYRRLPAEVQQLADRCYQSLLKTLVIRHCISSGLGNSGRFVSVCIIAPWQSRKPAKWFGFGSVRTLDMTLCSRD